MNNAVGVGKTRGAEGQFVRYGVVGIVSNLLGYLLYWLVTYLGVEPKKAMTLLYLAGAMVGFFGNRQWAFAHKGGLLGSGIRYFIAHVFGYLINLFMLVTFVDIFGYSHQGIQAAAIIVVAGFLFFTFKYFVFSTAGTRSRGSE